MMSKKYTMKENKVNDDSNVRYREDVSPVSCSALRQRLPEFSVVEKRQHRDTATGTQDEGSEFMERDFYVDDGVISTDTVEKAIQLAQEATEICKQGGLRLHKFVSNSPAVLQNIPPSECAIETKTKDVTFKGMPQERALGIKWNIERDCFRFDNTSKDQPATRRGILSTVASIYDPLGFLAPFVLHGKRILQEMCHQGINWDDSLPEALRPRWESWQRDFANLDKRDLPTPQSVELELSLGDSEVRKTQAMLTKVTETFSLAERLSKFSSWSKTVKAVARLIRRAKKVKSDAPATVSEQESAVRFIIQDVQKHTYGKEIKLLNKGNQLPHHNKLFHLDIFRDTDGLIKVGGRLSSIKDPFKHPIVIPKEHHVTKLIIAHCHDKVKHQGKGFTTNEIRSSGYWIPGMSRTVASFIRQCVICRRLRKAPEGQRMSDLPAERLEPSPPFTYCGTNFVGAKNEFKTALSELDTQRLSTYLSQKQCDFVMNAPHSGHAGGVWERQIRTVRSVLNTTLSLAHGRLNDASLRTLFYEAMAIVNSRPLTVDNLNNPDSLEPLTPNHLLHMKSSTTLPPPGVFSKEDLYGAKRWRRVQFLTEQFCCRWRREYLQNIIARQRWHSPKRNLREGDIVLDIDELSPRGEWRLARVLETVRGKDGLVRRVKISYGDRKLNNKGQRSNKLTSAERPVQKLILILECS
ncbi:hypothetical protein QQF64_022433 [Cirrhinus molitorella]|uniref:Integrase zinc-binding domain-containing protein n=1 Tax=Cirrhinus molitorella TaxID=172907 RepID=A0ABR3L9P1_9TELE